MSKSDTRKELLEKMGGKCIKCGQNDIRILHIDHIQGQGYLEKEYFVEKEKMYGFYLKYFDDESPFLQILCVNCNLAKRMDKKEGRGRPNLATIIGVYQHTLLEGTENELDSLCIEYPQFGAIRNRLRSRLPLALDLQNQKKNIYDQISTLAQELPFGFITHESPKILEEIHKLERIQNRIIKFIKEREVINKSYTRTSGELWDLLKKEFDLSVPESTKYIRRMLDKGLIEEVRDSCFKTVQK
jgi:hypothetical protein